LDEITHFDPPIRTEVDLVGLVMILRPVSGGLSNAESRDSEPSGSG
jgi:hypothetical protein